jgi:amino acid transporter
MTPPPAAEPPTANVPPLQRRIGLLQATAMNMTNMIGIGPFITIPALMTAMGGPQAMLGWIVALVIALADGMMWSELGAAMPGSGGSYGYLRNAFGRETFGRMMAFLFIWQFVVSGPLEIASGYIGFVQYLQYVWPTMTVVEARWIKVGIGVLAVALLFRRITAIGRITVALWIGTMLTVGIVMVSGVIHFDPKVAFDFPPGAFDFSLGYLMGLGAASRVGVYDYLGYYNVCHVGDEVKDPGRVIPRSIVISLIAVAGIYLVMNMSIISVVPWREFVPKDGVLSDPPPPIVADFISRLYGDTAAKIFTGMVLWTAFACVFALLLGYSRVPYAAARDGVFLSVFARVHPRHGFPHYSLLFVGGLSILFSFFHLQTVIDALLGTRIIVQFIGQIAAIVWLRTARPGMVRPFRMWLYPLPALIAFFGWTFLFATSPGRIILFSLAVPAAGAVVYLIWAGTNGRWPFGVRGDGPDGTPGNADSGADPR